MGACGISIHALREEGDGRERDRGAYQGDFYPRPPRGGRRAVEQVLVQGHVISIHALREEGDLAFHVINNAFFDFYPRPPRGGRRKARSPAPSGNDFYPRPPRGGRRGRCGCIRLILAFLSTPSARRATGQHQGQRRRMDHFYPRPPRGGRPDAASGPCKGFWISIHALREEGDEVRLFGVLELGDFYPRPPRGGRPTPTTTTVAGHAFLSTPSARRATINPEPDDAATDNFYPRPPRGGRHKDPELFMEYYEFLSTPSARRATVGCRFLQR